MKTTINISLNNLLFHIEDDAYKLLKGYLKSIENHFKNKAESKEIISDFEIRISELFKERLGKTREVINIEDVKAIIQILGDPDEIGAEQTNFQNESDTSKTTSKRLFRNLDNRVLGGICSGIAAYFNIDPIIPRILFLIAFFGGGIGIIIYIILWIVIPEAKTTSDKYEMRGESFNISNLGKNIKDEFNNVKNKMNL